MFHSMNTITFMIVMISILVPSFSLRKGPYLVAKTAVINLISSKKIFFHFLSLFLILYFNVLEQTYGENLSTRDFTPFIQHLEGDSVYFIQHLFLNTHLTYILTFFYIIVLPTLMVSSIITYLNQDDQQLFYAFIYALMLNYIIAIPFYLFFPVFEVWFYNPNVHFLIPQVFPSFDIDYRPLSGINNNFPSLHTSISMTVSIIAMHTKGKTFKIFTLGSTIIIIFSTIYLGIHWLTDLAAGALLSVIATKIGLTISEQTVNGRLTINHLNNKIKY